MRIRPGAAFPPLLLILSMLLLIFVPVNAKAAEYDETEIRDTAALILSLCAETDDNEYETLQNMRERDLDYTLLENGIPCGGSDYLMILQSWREAQDECGSYSGSEQEFPELVDTFEVEERNGDINLGGVMEFAERDANVEFTFDPDGTITALTIGGLYSPGEIMKKAGQNTLIGMGTVFAVLILMSLLISGFKVINKIQARIGKNKNSEEEPPEENAVSPDQAEEIDEDTLYAIIAAVSSELRKNPLKNGE